MNDDPVLAGLERIHAHGEQTVRRIEADHARLLADRPDVPPPPPPPSVN